MKKPMTYLFPFEKVPRGSKIVLYGFGNVGRNYYSQLCRSGYCEIATVVDENYKKFADTNFAGKICAPDSLPRIDFDFVVIGAVKPEAVSEITAKLAASGIPADKTICAGDPAPLYAAEVVPVPSPADDIAPLSPDRLNIVLNLGGGLGDYIVALKVFEILAGEAPGCRIDIVYRKNQMQYAQCIYGRQKNTGSIFDEKFYETLRGRYDLAVTVEHFWIIDHWDEDRLLRLAPGLCGKIRELLRQYPDYCADILTRGNNGLFMRRCLFWGLNRYTALGHRGIFDVNDKKVTIFLEEWAKKAYDRLRLPKRYITMNYGAGVIMVKLWTVDSMGWLAALLHKTYPGTAIIQIGGKGAKRIPNMDRYVLGEDLETVKHILKNSCLHIDCEGGLVHMATQLGTKCCVLAGPTPMEYYGYEENINIVSDVCKECDDVFPTWAATCMRGMEKPECMYSITPEYVMERIAPYLDHSINDRLMSESGAGV